MGGTMGDYPIQQWFANAFARGEVTSIVEFADRVGKAKFTALVNATANEAAQETVLHQALAEEFKLVSVYSRPEKALKKSLIARRVLLRTLLRASESSGLWCPLVNAVHYRLINSLRMLLEVSPSECLRELDINGQHVLHVASAAKASGIATRLLLGGSDTTLRTVGEHIGVRLPLPPPRRLTVSALNEATSADDLALLLAAGRARLDSASFQTWIHERDTRGLAPLHHACRAGRAAAVSTLLDAGADGLFATGEWDGTCGHLAASRGHAETLRAWLVGMLSQRPRVPTTDAQEQSLDASSLPPARTSPASDGGGPCDATHAATARALMLSTDGFGRTVTSVLPPEVPPEAWRPFPDCSATLDVDNTADADVEATCAPEAPTATLSIEANGSSSELASSEGADAATWWAPPDDALLGLADSTSTTAYANPPVGHVEVVDGMLTRREFVRRFESIGRPVLLRNASDERARHGVWHTRTALLAAVGDLIVTPTSMPYQHQTPPPGGGGDGGTTPMTLHDFFSSAMGPRPLPRSAATAAPPPFVFDSRSWRRSELGGRVGAAPAVLDVREMGVVLAQLSISPPLAGAHTHYHGTAYNELLVGRRRWALTPPHANAEFSLEPAVSLFARRRHGPQREVEGESVAEAADVPWLDAEQRPGDVLYVPMQWAHATLSLGESVAVAVEYV